MADFNIAIAVALSTATLFIFLSSVWLDEKHWQLKMGLFYGALALGWTLVFTAVGMAQVNASGTIIETSVTNAYYAYTIVGILCIIYLAIRMFAFAFGLLMKLVKPKTAGEQMEEDHAW